jgi:hypothetical protein
MFVGSEQFWDPAYEYVVLQLKQEFLADQRSKMDVSVRAAVRRFITNVNSQLRGARYSTDMVTLRLQQAA